MKWPPCLYKISPDLNIIESLWDYLDERKAEKQPQSKEHMWQVHQDARNIIAIDIINKLQQYPQKYKCYSCCQKWTLRTSTIFKLLNVINAKFILIINYIII